MENSILEVIQVSPMGFEKTALIRDLMPWFGFPETDSEIWAQVVDSNGEISIN